MKKVLVTGMLSTLLSVTTASALNIELNGQIKLESGRDCSRATYRLGTHASYKNQALDLIVQITNEDNEYNGGRCVDLQDNVLSFHLRDRDYWDNAASMDFKITTVKKNTNTPVVLNKLQITNFDLDVQGRGLTSTDDVYYKDPASIYLSEDSDVKSSVGNYFYQYTHKLRGKNNANCEDSATLTSVECRAGVLYQDTATFYARVQNDNAYGRGWSHYRNHRLIQLSFESKDIKPLITDPEPILENTSDYGDAPEGYPAVSHILSPNLYLGNQMPDAEPQPQPSEEAIGDGVDDNDALVHLPTLTVGNNAYAVPVKVYNNTGKNAYITAWIDFNNDNIFETKEALNTNVVAVPSSNKSQIVNLVWDSYTNTLANAITEATEGTAIMRLRLSTSRISSEDSQNYSEDKKYKETYLVSPDGEVEDYQIKIEEKESAEDCYNFSTEIY